jgi:signal transduction histidine kinase
MFARTHAPGFNPDEISRLTVVSDELASFLSSEKNKKNEIALAERQRLIRDLHDSITQKLYGMVTLTEAVQLGLETGAIQNSGDHMARISENARQALREMRLFLFELQPVDLEREGLVYVIRQRIASVEDRSGIRARINCDDEISLSAEKERALYYILQEALNNILKHARAKSILVKLKQRKHSIYLEINDDGRGFDPKGIERGRLGVQNMYARAEQIGAKLKITSAVNNGTKITISVPK